MEDVTTEEGDRLTGGANEDPLEMKVPISVFLYYPGLQPKQVPLPSHYIIGAVTSSQTRWLICELDLKVRADKHRLNDKKSQLGKEKKTDIPAKLFNYLIYIFTCLNYTSWEFETIYCSVHRLFKIQSCCYACELSEAPLLGLLGEP